MIYDKQIYKLIKEIMIDCDLYLLYVDKYKEGYNSDKKIEEIINHLRMLRSLYNKNFDIGNLKQ